MSKLPPFIGGVRVVPYYAGPGKTAWRVDISRPRNGVDVTDEKLLPDAIALAKKELA